MHIPPIWHVSMTNSLRVPPATYIMANVLLPTPSYSFIPPRPTLVYPVPSPINGNDDVYLIQTQSLQPMATYLLQTLIYGLRNFILNCWSIIGAIMDQ
jgi:hypothetical protein